MPLLVTWCHGPLAPGAVQRPGPAPRPSHNHTHNHTPPPAPPLPSPPPPPQVREDSPQWLLDEVAATRSGLLALRQNVVLLKDPEDKDKFYPR